MNSINYNWYVMPAKLFFFFFVVVVFTFPTEVTKFDNGNTDGVGECVCVCVCVCVGGRGGQACIFSAITCNKGAALYTGHISCLSICSLPIPKDMLFLLT